MRIDAQLSGCDPILCAHLLRKVDLPLIDLLQSLSSEEWNLQTIAPRWKVRDVAAHLLDTTRPIGTRKSLRLRANEKALPVDNWQGSWRQVPQKWN